HRRERRPALFLDEDAGEDRDGGHRLVVAELLVLAGHVDFAGPGLVVARAIVAARLRRLLEPGERALEGRTGEGQARQLGRLECHDGPAGDRGVIVARALRIAPTLTGVLRGDQEVDGLL